MGPVGLYGRELELREVAEAVAARVALVLVVGDAGIGKTSLVRQALGEAQAGGGVAVLGGCLSLAEQLPLLPFAEALRGLDAPVVARGVAGVPASLRPALSSLVPANAAAQQRKPALQERAVDALLAAVQERSRRSGGSMASLAVIGSADLACDPSRSSRRTRSARRPGARADATDFRQSRPLPASTRIFED
jgi:ABC-type branched-subunit amino acid transport system ATPase component